MSTLRTLALLTPVFIREGPPALPPLLPGILLPTRFPPRDDYRPVLPLLEFMSAIPPPGFFSKYLAPIVVYVPAMVKASIRFLSFVSHVWVIFLISLARSAPMLLASLKAIYSASRLTLIKSYQVRYSSPYIWKVSLSRVLYMNSSSFLSIILSRSLTSSSS